MFICDSKKVIGWLSALLLIILYSLTAPSNHSEAEDVYQFAKSVEQGTFSDQASVNRVLALPVFRIAYKGAQLLYYSGRSFPLMIFLNRLLAVTCLVLFYHILGGVTSVSFCWPQARPVSPYSNPKASYVPILGTLCLAFSYGFWRYANEAETYMLASVFLLGAWFLVLSDRWLWAIVASALGVLMHLLNLIPLLLIIPFYYLLSKEWKKAFLHGGVTGVLVVAGYVIFRPFLDFSELGAQHHSLEAGVSLGNLLRGGIGFGQGLISGNFLFGFEEFREVLVELFPSRMLDEEFYMAVHMSGWIKWAGCGTLFLLVSMCMWLLICWIRGMSRAKTFGSQRGFKSVVLNHPFVVSCSVWLVLYAMAVIRTEAGSPELWIMALIPFWLLASSLLELAHRANATTEQGCNVGSKSRIMGRVGWGLVTFLFIHNFLAGLLPVMSEASDYHASKGKWLVENSTPDDLILTSYEPIMIFYLDYFAEAEILSSGIFDLEDIQHRFESCLGTTYALSSFFNPLESMAVRSSAQYERMNEIGKALAPKFERSVSDEFGGIYIFKTGGLNE